MISGLDLESGDDEAVRKACDVMSFEARRLSDFSFLFSHRGLNPESPPLEYRYTLVSANMFGFSADDRVVLRFFARDTPEASLALKQQVLRGSNGLAELYRPGPDLLVVKSLLGAPNIYARCR